MKRRKPTTPAEQIIRRISDLRELSRRLAQAGYKAGLHAHNPNRVAERAAVYGNRARP